MGFFIYYYNCSPRCRKDQILILCTGCHIFLDYILYNLGFNAKLNYISLLIFSHFSSPFYLKIYGWRNSFLSLQRLRGSLDQIMGLTYLKIGFYFLFIFVTERSTAPQMDERLVEVFRGYVTQEYVAVLLCGNLRRIHLHLTQIFATTNFLFNLVEELFKVFFFVLVENLRSLCY